MKQEVTCESPVSLSTHCSASQGQLFAKIKDKRYV